MRMYTIHSGFGLENRLYQNPFIANMPYDYFGWQSGAGHITHTSIYGYNARVVSHQEIFKSYGIKGGHGEYCIETQYQYDPDEIAFQLPVGGYGDMQEAGLRDVRGFYLKFDFMYINAISGEIVGLHRPKFTGDDVSNDFTMRLSKGYISLGGNTHVTQPDTDPPSYRNRAWFGNGRPERESYVYLEPNKWHEIQIFVAAYVGWNVSEVGPNLGPPGYYEAPTGSFIPYFVAKQQDFLSTIPRIFGAETRGTPEYPLRLEQWPANGQPNYPNAMMPGQDQTAWPPENYASGQYFYGDNLGMVYVWVDGKIEIQKTINMSNETDGWDIFSDRQSLYLGRTPEAPSINELDQYRIDYRYNQLGTASGLESRFFFDNIIMNDIRDPSDSYPSKIFDPPFSSHESLEWNPEYQLKFTAMEIDHNYWDSPQYYLDGYPFGALVPSGDPYWINAPNRYGSSTDSMIPHGTKLTVIHVDWESEDNRYFDWVQNDQHEWLYYEIMGSGERYPSEDVGNATWYNDYNVDYRYQLVQPQESNPMFVNQDDPRLISGKYTYLGQIIYEPSGAIHKQLFYLKRPPTASGQPPFPVRHPRAPYHGKQPLAGGYGLGGAKDYSPNIHTKLGDTSLPPIYRIWTCLQDHSIGTGTPREHQYHMIRVPSGVSGTVDFLSDNACPGNISYYTYTGNGAIGDSVSMADWPYNPVTGDPWTWDDLDVLRVGACHSGHKQGNHVLLHTAFLVVEHGSSQDIRSSALGNNLLEWNVADDIPFYLQTKNMYHPERQNSSRDFDLLYNRWDIDPLFGINRSDTQTAETRAIINNPQFSGIIEYDYYIKYLNGERIEGNQYRKFDEHYDEVWVYTHDGIEPSHPFRNPFNHEVITDVNGNHFTFLTYPVLEWNTQKYPTDKNLSPLHVHPWVRYDYNTLYVIPFKMHNIATLLDPEEMFRTWTDPLTKPAVESGGQWIINQQGSAFNFKIDPDSYFHPFSPSSIINYASTHPNESLDYTFPPSRDGHDYYFQAPDLPSGSVTQTIPLAYKYSISDSAIDNELYTATIGLYQTTANEAVPDTGEAIFEFYSGPPSIDTYISGYTFGQDATVGWHLNETTVTLPSGTRHVKFTFHAIRNTDAGNKSPGGTLGGTSNFASFDEPFFILNLASGIGDEYHPADTNENNYISSDELADYTERWQNGTLSLGEAKSYLTKAERIWQSGMGGYHDAEDGPKPENWMGS